jgi:hypothetical protein
MRSIRFVYDNPRQVLGEYNPVEDIAQISPTPLLLPARNDALTPAAFAIAAYEKALEPKRPEIVPAGPLPHAEGVPAGLAAGGGSSPAGAITSSIRPDFSAWEWASHSSWLRALRLSRNARRPAACRHGAAGSSGCGTAGRRW